MIEKCENRKASPRFLIIEDEPLIIDLMIDIVCALGYAISGTAHTLSSARQELCKDNFDAVLLDLGVDGERGPEIADQLLEMRVPFGFVTGYDSPFDERHANVPLLRKPFTIMQLGGLLEKLAGPAPGQQPGKLHAKCNPADGTVVFI